jgi:dTDP-4-amino-4,6-dideoxygalactose transaminase
MQNKGSENSPSSNFNSQNDYRIDFNKPCLTGNELEYIQQTIQNHRISGDGSFTKKCSLLLEKDLGVPKVLLTTSCTHALEMSAILLGIQPGDEVVIPSFTFVSTVNAFVLRGAKPVFIDSRPDTLNMDENQLERLITPHTKAVVPVHYAGVGCEMGPILEIADNYNLTVIEDNAHGLFGKYRGKFLGTFGKLAAQSFHETKNVTCGEGGALLINDSELIENAEIIREKGTDRSKFFRGQVDKYGWVDIGSSYLPSEILAAFLLAQLENWRMIQEKRKIIWEYYHSQLTDWAVKTDVRQPVVPPECDQSYHMYYLLMPSLEKRQEFIQYLKSRGILSVFHYLPLNTSKMGEKFGAKAGDCPVAERISDQLVRLPFHLDLRHSDLEQVVDTISQFHV